MEAVLSTDTRAANFTEQLVQFWIERCNDFLHWQMEEVIKKEPSAQTLALHRQNLRAILHTGRMLYADIADPESLLNRLAPQIPGKLHQLEDSWEMIHNPMPDAEANELLKKYFPDESGSGSPA